MIEKNKNIISLIKDKGEHYYISKYSSDFKEIIQPKIQLIDSNYMTSILDKESIIVINSDESKELISQIVKEKIKVFSRSVSSIDMISLSHKLYDENKFEDVAYIEPMYVKKPYVS